MAQAVIRLSNPFRRIISIDFGTLVRFVFDDGADEPLATVQTQFNVSIPAFPPFWTAHTTTLEVGDTSVSYNSGTGNFTFNEPDETFFPPLNLPIPIVVPDNNPNITIGGEIRRGYINAARTAFTPDREVESIQFSNIDWRGIGAMVLSFRGPAGRHRGELTTGIVAEPAFYRALEKIDTPTNVRGVSITAGIDAQSAAASGNKGNGALTLHGSPVGAGAKAGVYRVTITDAIAGIFAVADPLGAAVGTFTTGNLFDGQVRFTLNTGGTPFAIGDSWQITVAPRYLYIDSVDGVLAREEEGELSDFWDLENVEDDLEEFAEDEVSVIGPWFFNRSGTEAQAIARLAYARDGDDLPVFTWHRVKITVEKDSVGEFTGWRRKVVDDTFGTIASRTMESSIDFGPGIGDEQTNTQSSLSEEHYFARTPIAVDYIGDQEVMCFFEVTADIVNECERFNTVSTFQPGTSDHSYSNVSSGVFKFSSGKEIPSTLSDFSGSAEASLDSGAVTITGASLSDMNVLLGAPDLAYTAPASLSNNGIGVAAAMPRIVYVDPRADLLVIGTTRLVGSDLSVEESGAIHGTFTKTARTTVYFLDKELTVAETITGPVDADLSEVTARGIGVVNQEDFEIGATISGGTFVVPTEAFGGTDFSTGNSEADSAILGGHELPADNPFGEDHDWGLAAISPAAIIGSFLVSYVDTEELVGPFYFDFSSRYDQNGLMVDLMQITGIGGSQIHKFYPMGVI